VAERKTEKEIREEIARLEALIAKAKRRYAIEASYARIAALQWVLGEETVDGLD
jgi:hypothetical protein